MNKNSALILNLFILTTLSACQVYDPTPKADNVIRVTQNAQGGTATPPQCVSWSGDTDPFDNQLLPQYGCADARNLAMTVESPNDLVAPQDMGSMRGVMAVGAIRRYDNNQTRGLIMPGADDNQMAVTTSSAGASSMSGDITGGASSSSSSSSSSAPSSSSSSSSSSAPSAAP